MTTRFTVDGPAGPISALHWPGEGTPALLLHPVNTAAAVWAEVAPALSREVVALDYRGHGASGPGPSYLPGDYAADALAVLDHLGWDRVHLVGGSIGGAVCAEVAARRAEKVRSIACFGSALRIGMPETDLEPLLSELGRLGTDAWFRQRGPGMLGPLARPGSAERLAALAGGRDPAMVADIVRATFCQADSRAVAASLPRYPAFVAVGAYDSTCPAPMAYELAGALGTGVMVLPGIGHLPMLEAPEEVAALLTAFHDRVEADARQAMDRPA
ncbi:alpha/beta fold hydrolase [Amycolatopsis jejuensis]|uniref:alpha/beta fold hydrolase n=1 Tax=Amycolatopsis jejuensis TaxID=330084 RepID=UPI0006898B71|nr:alpha/beta hydrolase [Amycolatopsis jejuensis]